MTGHDGNPEEDARKLSMRIVDRVAAANGVDPATLDPPLHEVVDPAALDSLFGTVGGDNTANTSATFPYAGQEVTISPDSTVHLG